MKKILISIIISLILTVVLIYAYDTFYNKKDKIAYIRLGLVLQEYEGMKEADQQYAQELSVVQANIDTLRNRYEKAASMNDSENSAEELYIINILRNEYETYNNTAYQQMQDRKNELTQNIVKKVNSFIEDYGKKHEYKMIFGATTAGSIMYGHESDDLSDIIIEMLNQEFEQSHNIETEK